MPVLGGVQRTFEAGRSAGRNGLPGRGAVGGVVVTLQYNLKSRDRRLLREHVAHLTASRQASRLALLLVIKMSGSWFRGICRRLYFNTTCIWYSRMRNRWPRKRKVYMMCKQDLEV